MALASTTPTQEQILKTMTLDGKTVALPRIVGGKPAADNEFKFAAYLRLRSATGTMMCTGSLIAPNVVLTAAHCTVDRTGQQFEAKNVDVVFSHTAPTDSKPGATYGVKQMFTNPQFRASTLSNDLALLVLNTAVPKEVAVPVKIYTGAYSTDTPIIAAGYGITKPDSTSSAAPRLMQVALGVGSDAFCAKNAFGYDHEYQICTNGAAGKDTCQGDSGGPLTTTIGPNGEQALLGVTSFAPVTDSNPQGLCGVAGSSGFYVRAAAYMDWIQAATDLKSSDIVVSGKTPSTPKESPNGTAADSTDDNADSRPPITFVAPPRGPPSNGETDVESLSSGAGPISAPAVFAMVAALAAQLIIV
ncbi:hypothetical protein H4R19_003816 [Coemansia spiralis]|nr:hypothetical protein H4R19_003816 [Coemansia spiralis]